MPYGEYSSFSDCVSKNKSKRDPEAYCGSIKNKVEGKNLASSEWQGFNSYIIETKAGKEYFVEGYVATYDKDSVNDVINKSAMRDIYEQCDTLKADLDHEAFLPDVDGYGRYRSHSALIPVAKAVEKKIDNVGVWVKFQLNNHLQRFNEIWGSLQDRFLNSFSIAFSEPSKEDYIVQGKTRILNRIKSLLNVAITGNPVNKNAVITAVVAKSMIKMDEEDKTVEDDKVEPAVKEEESAPAETPVEAPSEAVESEAEVKTKVLGEIRKEIAEIKALVNVKPETEKIEKPLEDDALTELKAFRKELSELKAEMTKPVLKATQSIEEKTEDRTFSPMGYI